MPLMTWLKDETAVADITDDMVEWWNGCGWYHSCLEVGIIHHECKEKMWYVFKKWEKHDMWHIITHYTHDISCDTWYDMWIRCFKSWHRLDLTTSHDINQAWCILSYHILPPWYDRPGISSCPFSHFVDIKTDASYIQCIMYHMMYVSSSMIEIPISTDVTDGTIGYWNGCR